MERIQNPKMINCWKIILDFFSFFFFILFYKKKQDQIKSTMDEIKNNGAVIISDTKKTAIEKRGFVFETIFNSSDTGNTGEQQ